MFFVPGRQLRCGVLQPLVRPEHQCPGIAVRGLLVRHLVLPENIADTDATLEFLAREISTDTYLNIMDQYRPCYRVDEAPLDRRITSEEFSQALAREGCRTQTPRQEGLAQAQSAHRPCNSICG